MNTKAFIKWVPLAVTAAGLSSCIEINETVKLKKDGSGTIVEETIMGQQMSAMMDQLSALGGAAGGNDMFSEEAAKKRAEKFGKGVTVNKVEKLDKNGSKGGRVTFSFTDINTVTLSLADGASGLSAMAPKGASGVEEKVKEATPITFNYKEGVLTINNPVPSKEDLAEAKKEAKEATASEGATEGAEGPEAAQMKAMGMQMMKDMKMSVKVVVEDGIAETDASIREGDTITLSSVDFGKLMENPEMAKKLEKLDMNNPAAMEEELKGIEGIKGETKSKVTVKVK